MAAAGDPGSPQIAPDQQRRDDVLANCAVMGNNVVHVKRDPFDVYVGRPSRHVPEALWVGWGNPFDVRRHGREKALRLYHTWIYADAQYARRELARRTLRGKIVACWCACEGGIRHDADQIVCHGQILLRVADSANDEELFNSTPSIGNISEIV
jgi:hypothetical protein